MIQFRWKQIAFHKSGSTPICVREEGDKDKLFKPAILQYREGRTDGRYPRGFMEPIWGDWLEVEIEE